MTQAQAQPQPVTVLAAMTLKPDISEARLLEASERFQRDFVATQAGILRRELLRLDGERRYLDVVSFRARDDLDAVMQAEAACPAAQQLFALLDTDEQAGDGISVYAALARYER